MNTEPLEITEQKEVFDFACVKDLVGQALKTPQFNNSNSNISGIPSGYSKIDNITSGFQNGELTVIAVKSGMGKTSFMLSLANNVAVKDGKSLAIFSSERPATKIVKRIIETETGVSVDKLNNGKINDGDKDHLMGIVNNIASAKLYIDDTPSLSIDEFCSRAKQLKELNGIDIIFIDYWELMITSILDERNREEQLQEISKTIKMMAEELNIPIILFSQINSFGNEGALNESGVPNYYSESLDTVMMLNRTPYSTVKENGKRNTGEAEVVFVKHSNLKEYRTIGLNFIESIGKFVNY